MANFKQVAANTGFKGRFSRAASFGWFSDSFGIAEAATNISITEVLSTTTDSYAGVDMPGILPRQSQFTTTDWFGGSNKNIGIIVKQAALSCEIFVFFNTDEDLEYARQSFIAHTNMTSRKRIKEFKMGKAWKV